jgi:pyruvate formate lyase activating enzyme
MLSRRGFLTAAGRMLPLASAASLWKVSGVPALASTWALGRGLPVIGSAPRARYWVPVPGGAASPASGDCLACHRPDRVAGRSAYVHKARAVTCQLCAQECTIRDGGRGLCRARANVGGELRSLVYGRPLAIHVDPIEKKPFYHFLPGAAAFSFGTAGCPLSCRFCQNWPLSQSSQEDHDADYTTPAGIVQAARARRAPVIAFTYNEPTVFTEYLIDVAVAAREQGLRTVMVSCGFMNPEPLADICRALDAIKIDLKGFSDEFYRNVCGASLAPVLRTLKQIAARGTHLEIVNLVVPTLNDDDRALSDLARWIAGELGRDVPVHFNRFHPEYQLLHLPPTPVATLERARALAMERGLRYVYVGNVPSHAGSHTYCPRCGKVVIRRQAFFVEELQVKDGRCGYCGLELAGVWR